MNKYASNNTGTTTSGNNQQRRPERPQDKDLVNERIRFPEVLVIGPKGDKMGTMSSRQAADMAASYDLDLVCVNPTGQPPVCKILDYGKYRFEKQKKAKENKKKQKTVETKEVQLTPQIGQHDLETKVRQSIEFFKDGNKVSVGVRYKGRQMAHTEIGEDILKQFIQLVEEFATVEKQPVMDGRWLRATLAPKGNK